MVDPNYSGVGGMGGVALGDVGRRGPESAHPTHAPHAPHSPPPPPPLHPSHAPHPPQSSVEDTSEFISAVIMSSGGVSAEGLGHGEMAECAIVRISMLAAGFVCGVGGRNVSMIQRRTGASITSSVCSSLAVRSFKVSGRTLSQVKGSVAIMQEAVGVYKSLTEGDFRGQCVEPEISVQGISFSYAPPPKHKMPNAASVRKLPQSLAVRKEAERAFAAYQGQRRKGAFQSPQSTLDRDASSSVDSSESALQFGSSMYGGHGYERDYQLAEEDGDRGGGRGGDRGGDRGRGGGRERRPLLSHGYDRSGYEGRDREHGRDRGRRAYRGQYTEYYDEFVRVGDHEQYLLSSEFTTRSEPHERSYPKSHSNSVSPFGSRASSISSMSPIRVTQSASSLPDFGLARDRADGDWRQRRHQQHHVAPGNGNDDDNILRDFQGMQV